jgi:CRP/FNR family cyclic AMP-dependent transcriptional regulator
MLGGEMEKKSILKRVPLFNEVEDKELEKIAQISHLRKCRKDEDVFSEGEAGDALYIPVSGVAKVFRRSSDGRIKTLAILEKGDFLGEMAILDREICSANVRAAEDNEMLVINGRDFEASLISNPQIAFKIMETFSARLRDADKQIESLTFQIVSGRLVIALLDLAEKHGVQTEKGIKIDMELTHQELAEMVGTAREVVSRILNDFRKTNCVEIEKHHITITDKEELKKTLY